MSNRLSISLQAIADNYQKFCASSNAEVAAVVKADAYGLGVGPVATKLHQIGCNKFFVANLAEGQQLRELLGSATHPPEIYVLEGIVGDATNSFVSANLIPILNTQRQCRLWSTTQRPAGLHIDTGMQRLGLTLANAATALADIPLHISLLMTHLARADEPDHISTTQQIEQLRQFAQNQHPQTDGIALSISNSASLLSGSVSEDLARAGIGLYGGNPFAQQPNPMLPVVCFEAQVLQIRRVQGGMPVGYGGTHTTVKPIQLATLAAGYADGLPRLLSNIGRVWVGGQYCPIVGRVSMDMVQVDVTAVLDLAEGDWVELFGIHVGVDEIANHAKTLDYEILTGLGKRVPRTYTDRLLV